MVAAVSLKAAAFSLAASFPKEENEEANVWVHANATAAHITWMNISPVSAWCA